MAKKSAPKTPVVQGKTKKAGVTQQAPKVSSQEKTKPAVISQVLSASGGILKLAPTWVPRSFLMPGRRLKLHPADLYALGANRGGIDERWFSSTTAAANEGAPWDEGLSYVVAEGKRVFTLREAIAQHGESLVGSAIW